eukprot:4351342-Prymnesium_polylepis.1
MFRNGRGQVIPPQMWCQSCEQNGDRVDCVLGWIVCSGGSHALVDLHCSGGLCARGNVCSGGPCARADSML